MIYDLLAPFYDICNKDIDYVRWASFIDKILKKHQNNVPMILGLDLGCGTGSMTFELAALGYDMTGIDYSADMLGVARTRAEALGYGKSILWLNQDMREFELYGTVDFAVCCLDGINHLTNKKSLDKCFSLVHNYLVPDGIFIFDVNGKYKFENIYSDNSYVMELDGAFCVWQNYYSASSGICDFYITLFEENADGTYVRFDEEQREKMYTLRTLRNSLKNNGFDVIGAYSDFDLTEATDDNERIYIVARCKKEV